MTTDTRLDDLGDRLEHSIAAEILTDQRTAGRAATRARRSRPRLLAGSTLGLAAVGAALAIILGGTGATTPAYAITQKTDGTILLKINLYGRHTLAAADAKLIERYHETVLLSAAPSTGSGTGASSVQPGPSTSSAPVHCTPTADPYAPGDPMPSGPRIELLIGKDNTIVIASGNTGAGTRHLVSCATLVAGPGSNSGSGHTGS